MAPPDLTAHPLGLAEVVDRSIALGLRHFCPLFLAMLGIQGVALVLARQLPGLELLGALGDPERAMALATGAFRTVAVVSLLLLVLQSVSYAVAAVLVAPSLEPRHAVPRPARARAVLAVATATVLQVLLLAAAPVVGALPGIALALRSSSQGTLVVAVAAAMAGGAGLFLVATLRLILVPVVAALEGRGGLAALARSSRLMSPRPGGRFLERPAVRASLILLAVFVLAAAVNGLAEIPRALAVRAQAGGAGLGLMVQLPLPLEIAVSVLEALAVAALQPFCFVTVVVFYFDRRARREGLDVDAWAERLEERA